MSNHKKYKKNAPATLQLLRELEISLRTNHVGWVKQFIRDYSGLDALVDFLKFACWGLVVSTINVKVRKSISNAPVSIGPLWTIVYGFNSFNPFPSNSTQNQPVSQEKSCKYHFIRIKKTGRRQIRK